MKENKKNHEARNVLLSKIYEAQYMCKSTQSTLSACCVGKGNRNHNYKSEAHNVQLCDLDVRIRLDEFIF